MALTFLCRVLCGRDPHRNLPDQQHLVVGHTNMPPESVPCTVHPFQWYGVVPDSERAGTYRLLLVSVPAAPSMRLLFVCIPSPHARLLFICSVRICACQSLLVFEVLFTRI